MNPFEGPQAFFGQFLSDLAKVLGGSENRAALAEAFASQLLSRQESAGVLPDSRQAELREIIGVATRMVQDILDRPQDVPGRARVVVVDGMGLVRAVLSRWRHVLEIFMGTSVPAVVDFRAGDQAPVDVPEHVREALQHIGPAFGALQTGSLLARVAREVLGPADVVGPVWKDGPRPVVGENLHRFASDWSVSFESTALAVCAKEVAYGVLLSEDRLVDAVGAVTGRFLEAARAGSRKAIEALSQYGSLEELQERMKDPDFTQSLGIEIPERVMSELHGALGLFHGFAEVVASEVLQHAAGQEGAVAKEALARRFVERAPAVRALEQVLGIEDAQALVQHGARFVAEVCDRLGFGGALSAFQARGRLPNLEELDDPVAWLAAD
jgi:uncharacterized protein (DUF2342 family)